MKGWETIKVKQCFKFRNGKSFNGILKEKADNEYCYPVYGGNGVIGYCKTPLLKEPTLIEHPLKGAFRQCIYCSILLLNPNEYYKFRNSCSH